jgi:hypothetical protein
MTTKTRRTKLLSMEIVSPLKSSKFSHKEPESREANQNKNQAPLQRRGADK